MADPPEHSTVRYEPDERPPLPLALGTGLQAALTIVTPVVITVVIVARAAGQTDSYITWGAFAALLVSGATTILQAVRLGRFGSGHVLMMGTSGAFIAVCVAALEAGGPRLMASLVAVSSLFQFMLAARLSLLRRIFTPVVSGTVVMLIAATVLPIVFETLEDVPEGTPQAAAPIVAGTTIAVVAGIVLRGSPVWRLWAPITGIVVGCAVAAPFGIYDTAQVADATWVGVPLGSWPGIDLAPDNDFWALLPAFVVVTIVGAVETIGDGIAIQTVSRRKPPATDFRTVQGALNADGVGNLFSGLLGTLPNTTYSSSISVAEVTGVAARRVGVAIGGALLALAFFPKFTAALIAIPPAVAAAYITVLVGMLFVQGMRLVARDGINHRTAAVVGVSFWIGAGFQNGWIFPDLIEDGFFETLLGNGMAAGTLTAVLMTSFIELTAPKPRRLRIPLDGDALERLSEFLGVFAADESWDAESTGRLEAAGEETLEILRQHDGTEQGRWLAVTARADGSAAEIEFATVVGGGNIEDRLAYLDELPPALDEREVSFRLLRHYASSVRHQQYHGTDVISVTVEKQSSG
ncbi:MAG: hypothetical protein OXT07_11930 [bacterium]|nr:hypothetical protein [bacterium]